MKLRNLSRATQEEYLRVVRLFLGRYRKPAAKVGAKEVRKVPSRRDDTVTLDPQELIRRFLLHVLPPGFVKIRHVGLVASSSVKTRLELARRLLADHPLTAEASHPRPSHDWQALLEKLTSVDPATCPACGRRRWVRVKLPPALLPRAPPSPRP